MQNRITLIFHFLRSSYTFPTLPTIFLRFLRFLLYSWITTIFCTLSWCYDHYRFKNIYTFYDIPTLPMLPPKFTNYYFIFLFVNVLRLLNSCNITTFPTIFLLSYASYGLYLIRVILKKHWFILFMLNMHHKMLLNYQTSWSLAH